MILGILVEPDSPNHSLRLPLRAVRVNGLRKTVGRLGSAANL